MTKTTNCPDIIQGFICGFLVEVIDDKSYVDHYKSELGNENHVIANGVKIDYFIVIVLILDIYDKA